MTRRIIDESYFHISNGGLIIRTVEQTFESDCKWVLEHKIDNRGMGMDSSVPLRTVDQIDFYIGALQNIRKRMIAANAENYPLSPSKPKIIDGHRAEPVWVDTRGDNTEQLIGYRLFDGSKQVGFISCESDQIFKQMACTNAKTQESAEKLAAAQADHYARIAKNQQDVAADKTSLGYLASEKLQEFEKMSPFKAQDCLTTK